MTSFTVGQSNEFDKLLALAMFVQTPEYHARVKELRDLEAATRKSMDEATAQVSANNEALREIRDERQKHLIEVQQFTTSTAHARSDLARRERDLSNRAADISRREQELETEKLRNKDSVETVWKAQKTQSDMLIKREEAVKFREDRLTQERAAFNLQKDRIERAYRGD